MRKTVSIFYVLLFIRILFSANTYAQNKNIKSITLTWFCMHGGATVECTEHAILWKGKSKAMDKKVWEQLQLSIKDINLKVIDTFNSPTDYRASDAACYERLIFATKNKKYTTKYFDSGAPMKPVEDVYNQMEKISQGLDYSPATVPSAPLKLKKEKKEKSKN